MQEVTITGGSGDLGQALADEFSSDFLVRAASRSELDVTNREAVQRYFSNCAVDLLICAAGLIHDAPLAKMTVQDWDRIFAVNYQGALNCAQAALPKMRQQGSGHIVFISSYSAIHPPAGQVAYAAAKAALLDLTESFAAEHGKDQIRVNAILPGFLETRMTQAVSEKRRAEILTAHHLGKFNTTVHVAKFIRHLHEQLPFTSGQVFQLDSRNR